MTQESFHQDFLDNNPLKVFCKDDWLIPSEGVGKNREKEYEFYAPRETVRA